MFTGIRLKANPSNHQRLILSQWMGCARSVWNSKCDENRYYSTFARKYFPIGTYAPIDKTYSHFKDDELSPWLSECPSKIMANSSCNWFDTYQDFMKGRCGKPKRKRKDSGGSIYLTRDLFRFEVCSDGVKRLFIGAQRNNIGYLSLKLHKDFKEPKSIYVKKRHDSYWVSFCYDDGMQKDEILSQSDHHKYLSQCSEEFLQKHLIGIDRGVVKPIQAGEKTFDFTKDQKRNKAKSERYIKSYQRRMARQSKGSKRRHKTKIKLSKSFEHVANIRADFCHKASRELVDQNDARVFILEDLKTSQMTKRAKAKTDEAGKWLKNGGSAKSGLNKAILDKGWHKFEEFLKYKANRAGKAWFKVPAHHTSQECSSCGYTHPSNRKSQASFVCGSCGHAENADLQAAKVIKKRAIGLILNAGSALSERGVLLEGTGRGAVAKTKRAKVRDASGNEASKKKRLDSKALPLDFVLEASPL